MNDQRGRMLDVASWTRRDAYTFFRPYDMPFFNVCSKISVEKTWAWCRAHNASFALASWFVCQKAVNILEPFRYRLRREGVWVHDRVEIATTVLNEDQSFRFCYFPYAETFGDFVRGARGVLAEDNVRGMADEPENDAVIHGSTLPWVHFSSVTHPRRLGVLDSTPKIVFGKVHGPVGERCMPVSIEVHHALMDGLHVAQCFEALEEHFHHPIRVMHSP